MNLQKTSRTIVVLVALCGSLFAPAQQVLAKHLSPLVSDTASFSGQVTVLNGPKSNPTGFTIQLRNGRALDFKVTADTTYKALSAEAEVEGLVPNDYVVVLARHVRRVWVAFRISFDVRPIVPAPRAALVTVVGLVTNERADGTRLWMRLPSTEIRPVIITAKTTWRMDGNSTVGPLQLSKGNIVQVKMRRPAGSRLWYALDINLKSVSVLRT